MKDYKNIVAQMIVRWIFHFAGPFMVSLGVTEESALLWIMGAITFLISVVWSWINSKYLAKLNPENIKNLEK